MKKKTKKAKKEKAWAGRFKQPLSKMAEEFSSSIHYDRRLYKEDIVQSMVYARALAKAHILTPVESKKIVKALEEILKKMDGGRIKLKSEHEDIHMNIEMLLIEKVKDIGKKLHTGRSRNDQVATDMRMYLKWEITRIKDLINNFQEALVETAETNIKVIMPGYTHMQRAQPVLFSHHMMAYYEMLDRDKERFSGVYAECDIMPLGSGALCGHNFKIDRSFLAAELGFSKISKNSMDAVSDRDFMIDFVEACAVLMMHLSRFSEELILWSSYEFSFIELSDKYTTGSSIMPQKKNPDMAELIRGKTGRVYGDLQRLLVMMKGLPLTYNRDMQEDKEAVFDAIDTVEPSLEIFEQMIRTMKINATEMDNAAKKGFLTATDLAYYLVTHGVPFRQAHHIVGKIITYCEDSNMQLEYLSLKQLKQFSEVFQYDVQRILSAESSVAAKDITGGTAPAKVKEAIKRARKDLLHDKA